MEGGMARWWSRRLAKLLSYSYGGFLVIVLAGVLNDQALTTLRKAMSWELMAIAAVVVGAGVWAFHRNLIIPLHHFFSSMMWHVVFELPRSKDESLIPTRWLGSLDPPVSFWLRIPAYSALRHNGEIVEEEVEDRWDLEHAELGLLVLTGEGLLAAALIIWLAPGMVDCNLIKHLSPRILVALFFFLFIVTGIAAYSLHRTECLAFKAKRDEVVKQLECMGFTRKKTTPNAAQPASDTHPSQ
jgi:hypothetical protein